MARVGRASRTSARPWRRSRLLTWSWVLALTVLALAGAVLLAVLSTDTLVPDPGPSGGWVGAGLVVQLAGLALMFGYGLVAWRTGLFRAARWQPAAVLSWAQRRGLRAQVAGGGRSGAVPLTRDVARRLVLQRDQLLLLVGVVVQQLGRAIGEPARSTVVFTAVATVVLLAVAGLMWRQARRAERFLAEHPEPEHPEPEHRA